MSYQVLARKWRPKTFNDVIGQDHIIRSLQNSLKQNKLAHAYLFTGTRGVGKTTIARIFSKAIRCLKPDQDFNPCLVCESCLGIDHQHSIDYLEIDGASHNSVENVRNLVENVSYLPAKGRFKIYVIDEVHMLSVSAFNALLKTLEEPPAHVIFILATTDPHKLLGTVLSRLQRYDFKSVSQELLVQQIKKISQAEKIRFETESICSQIAELGQGSVRDTLSLLDQVLSLSSDQYISEDLLSHSLGLVSHKKLTNLIGAALSGEINLINKIFEELMSQNIEWARFNQQALALVYKILQSFDDDHQLEKSKIIEYFPQVSSLSFAEIFWIYETYVKDLDWAMKSPQPNLSLNLVWIKIARRREMLSSKPEKKKSIVKITTKNFEDFRDLLAKEGPTIKGQLDRGSLWGEIFYDGKELKAVYAFEKINEDAIEFLEDKVISPKLKRLLVDFYSIPTESISWNWKILSEEDVKKSNFISYNTQMDKEKIDKEKRKREELLNNPIIIEAEKLFNAKVDKIVTNNK